MKLLKCILDNFGSYKHLEFNYSDLGLTLLHGATGSGKSTLMDAPCWILYGETAKNGAADDVRSWHNPDTSTRGELEVQLPTGTIQVIRVRGKAGQNDLYWEDSEGLHRGKDITETQKLLNAKLGVDSLQYAVGAYYSEFSPSASFFTAKAKDRRELLESVAPLEFTTTLLERITSEQRTTRQASEETEKSIRRASTEIEAATTFLHNTRKNSERWEKDKEKVIEDLQQKHANFVADKAAKIKELESRVEEWDDNQEEHIHNVKLKLEDLESAIKDTIKPPCPTCGHSVENKELVAQKRRLENSIEIAKYHTNPIVSMLKIAKESINTYETRLAEAVKTVNPFTEMLGTQETNLSELSTKRGEILLEQTKIMHLTLGLENLQKVVKQARVELLEQAVKRIQSTTNGYISNYFDSEISVSLELEGSDNLAVSLYKNGYPCNFKQLSKGQRGILKLTFALAVMKESSNKNGQHFSTLFLDESVDGLDAELKTKAFKLFSELATEHDSVIVIDHSLELKNLFDNKFEVSLVNEESVIT